MALAYRAFAIRRSALPIGTPGPSLARRRLGAQPLSRRFAQDWRAMDSDFPGTAALLRRVLRVGRGRRGSRHHPLPRQQRKPAYHVHQDHSAGRRKALAEAVPQLAGGAGNGTRGRLPDPRRLRMDRKHGGDCGQALPDRSGGGLRTSDGARRRKKRRTRGAFSGAAGSGGEWKGREQNDTSRKRQRTYAAFCLSWRLLAFMSSTPKGTRTPVFWLRTRHPRPLDDGGSAFHSPYLAPTCQELCSRQSPNGKFTIFRILHFSFFGFVSDFVIRASNFSSLPQK